MTVCESIQGLQLYTGFSFLQPPEGVLRPWKYEIAQKGKGIEGRNFIVPTQFQRAASFLGRTKHADPSTPHRASKRSCFPPYTNTSGSVCMITLGYSVQRNSESGSLVLCVHRICSSEALAQRKIFYWKAWVTVLPAFYSPCSLLNGICVLWLHCGDAVLSICFLHTHFSSVGLGEVVLWHSCVFIITFKWRGVFQLQWFFYWACSCYYEYHCRPSVSECITYTYLQQYFSSHVIWAILQKSRLSKVQTTAEVFHTCTVQ